MLNYKLRKEAGITDTVTKSAENAVKGGWNVFKDWVLKPSILTVPITATTLGVLASKLGSPQALAETSEKQVLKAALDTEIAVMERRIAEEVLKRAQKNIVKKYDRFV